MLEDFKLSDHFSYFELTATSNAALQFQNRIEGMSLLPTARALASFLEQIRGDRPLIINSAFRSWILNGQTRGSSPTSQHPRFQAADAHRPGQDTGEFFKETLQLLKDKRIPFGQLIHEKADRGYAVVQWVHISLGKDFWNPERCGEVLTMVAGPDGKSKYELLEKVQM